MKHENTEFLIGVAKLAAQQSKAIRLKVGGVITDSLGNFVAYSYNGTPRGMDNTCEYKEFAAYPDRAPDEHFPLIGNRIDSTPYRSITKPLVVHCEANLIAHAARRGISVNGGSVFLTHSPCEQCSSLLIQAGINDVYFLEEFRTYDIVKNIFDKFLNFHRVVL